MTNTESPQCSNQVGLKSMSIISLISTQYSPQCIVPVVNNHRIDEIDEKKSITLFPVLNLTNLQKL